MRQGSDKKKNSNRKPVMTAGPNRKNVPIIAPSPMSNTNTNTYHSNAISLNPQIDDNRGRVDPFVPTISPMISNMNTNKKVPYIPPALDDDSNSNIELSDDIPDILDPIYMRNGDDYEDDENGEDIEFSDDDDDMFDPYLMANVYDPVGHAEYKKKRKLAKKKAKSSGLKPNWLMREFKFPGYVDQVEPLFGYDRKIVAFSDIEEETDGMQRQLEAFSLRMIDTRNKKVLYNFKPQISKFPLNF
jgi:hypothetical protein